MRVWAVTGGLMCALLALAAVGVESSGDARRALAAVPADDLVGTAELEPAGTPPTPAEPAPRSGLADSQIEGQPGAVSLPLVQVADLGDVAGVIIPGKTTLSFISATGPTAYRSPASSGVQEVQAKYLLEQWSGSEWVIVAATDRLYGVIGAAQIGVVFNSADLRPNPVARGYWRVKWVFAWYSSGALLATTISTPDNIEAYVCITQARRCQPRAGWVETGGYLDNT